MKTMKLISTTDFVLQIDDYVHESHNIERGFNLIKNYAKFLKQPLELWMFVPCWFDGGKWLPFDESELFDYTDKGKKYWIVGSETFEYKEYQKAKERVLFEGFEIEKTNYDNSYSIFIESPDLGFDKLYFDTFHFDKGGFVRRKGITIEELIGTVNPNIGHLILTSTALKQIGINA